MRLSMRNTGRSSNPLPPRCNFCSETSLLARYSYGDEVEPVEGERQMRHTVQVGSFSLLEQTAVHHAPDVDFPVVFCFRGGDHHFWLADQDLLDGCTAMQEILLLWPS
jgi:hypothetical protein